MCISTVDLSDNRLIKYNHVAGLLAKTSPVSFSLGLLQSVSAHAQY